MLLFPRPSSSHSLLVCPVQTIHDHQAWIAAFTLLIKRTADIKRGGSTSDLNAAVAPPPATAVSGPGGRRPRHQRSGHITTELAASPEISKNKKLAYALRAGSMFTIWDVPKDKRKVLPFGSFLIPRSDC
jgi:hypothetical protein